MRLNEMKFQLGIVILVLGLSGCNSVKRMLNGKADSPPSQSVGDYWKTSGVTSQDFITVYAVPTDNRDLVVRVQTPSDSQFRNLNEYEYGVDIKGKAVWFKKKVDVGMGGVITIFPYPVAPTGSKYEIISTARNSTSGLY